MSFSVPAELCYFVPNTGNVTFFFSNVPRPAPVINPQPRPAGLGPGNGNINSGVRGWIFGRHRTNGWYCGVTDRGRRFWFEEAGVIRYDNLGAAADHPFSFLGNCFDSS
jgi:hypothetical protein